MIIYLTVFASKMHDLNNFSQILHLIYTTGFRSRIYSTQKGRVTQKKLGNVIQIQIVTLYNEFNKLLMG